MPEASWTPNSICYARIYIYNLEFTFLCFLLIPADQQSEVICFKVFTVQSHLPLSLDEKLPVLGFSWVQVEFRHFIPSIAQWFWFTLRFRLRFQFITVWFRFCFLTEPAVCRLWLRSRALPWVPRAYGGFWLWFWLHLRFSLRFRLGFCCRFCRTLAHLVKFGTKILQVQKLPGRKILGPDEQVLNTRMLTKNSILDQSRLLLCLTIWEFF